MPGQLAVSAHPNLTSLPGSNVLQQLVNGAEAWALAVALLGAFIGAALWAVASHSHNRADTREFSPDRRSFAELTTNQRRRNL